MTLPFIHKYHIQFRYSYWWRARYVGVFKSLIMTSVYNRLKRILRASLDARRFLLRAMQALLVSWPRCVAEHVAPRLNAHAHEQDQKLSEIGMQHADVVHVHVTCTYHGGRNIQSSSTSETDNFYRVSYFITPFNLKGIWMNGNKKVDY